MITLVNDSALAMSFTDLAMSLFLSGYYEK